MIKCGNYKVIKNIHNITKEDIIDEIEEIPQSNLDLKHTITNEINKERNNSKSNKANKFKKYLTNYFTDLASFRYQKGFKL